jgi:hypothetical protein
MIDMHHPECPVVQANAKTHLPPEAGATQERTL